jgi:hypothetical protein
MDKELRNRENRLRYRARQKGLYIQKGKWYQYYSQYSYESNTGYCIGRLDKGMLITGYDQWNNNLLTIEEAEEYVSEY